MKEKDRQRAIDVTLAQMEKQFGRGAVLRLGSSNVIPVTVIPTGSISVDEALGVGGFPRGRMVEVYGPEASGKTTIALQVIAQAHQAGGTAAFIDAEHALDATYARRLGVDVDNLLISQPDYGEQALEITSALVSSGVVDIIVIDSVAALVPKAELEGEMGDSHMGLHARLMSQAMRKLAGSVARTNTCLVFINQIREKIGVMFGNPETTTGGRALKFYCSVRVEVRRIGAIKDGDKVVGSRTRIKIVKNKVAAPFREAEVDLIHGEGISRESDLVDAGVRHRLLTKSGTWFSYGGERLGQGRENAKVFLKQNPDIRERLEAQLRKAMGLSAPATGEETPSKPAGLQISEAAAGRTGSA
jgi:recombination protein RecA